MLEMIRGCTVPHPELLNEEFDRDDRKLCANVHARNIFPLFRDFIQLQNQPLFFVLEIPVNQKEEQQLRQREDDPLHKAVYYLDNLTKEDALALLEQNQELLVHDGMSAFGFGVRDFSAELMKYRYNELLLWTKDFPTYTEFFLSHGIPQVPEVFTAWQTFSKEQYGECAALNQEGVTIYDLVEHLKQFGLYFAEFREC